MVIADGFTRAISIAVALVAAGCATTQTAAFRRMTAEDHEKAGLIGAGAEDAPAHFAAARELRHAEQSACYEVPDVERDAGPFARTDQIASVEILRDRANTKAALQPVGVAVYLRAAPGMTEQGIGRAIECHLAHNAVVGTHAAEQACPLSVESARIDLAPTHTGFRVSITSKDIAVARSLIERCRALVD